MDNQQINWQAPAYVHMKKSADWYWAFWIISGSIVVTCILLQNIIFGVFILVASFSLSLFASKDAPTIHYEINKDGVIVEQTLYPFETLEAFGIDVHTPIYPKLILKSKKFFMSYVIIPLGPVSPEEIKNILSPRIPEEDHKEPLSLKFMEYLGF